MKHPFSGVETTPGEIKTEIEKLKRKIQVEPNQYFRSVYRARINTLQLALDAQLLKR